MKRELFVIWLLLRTLYFLLYPYLCVYEWSNVFNDSNTNNPKWSLIYCNTVFFCFYSVVLWIRTAYVIHLAYIIILVRYNGAGQLFRYFIIKVQSLLRAWIWKFTWRHVISYCKLFNLTRIVWGVQVRTGQWIV